MDNPLAIENVRAALEAANGNVRVAAHVLGVTEVRVRRVVDNTPDLCAMYGRPSARKAMEEKIGAPEQSAQMIPMAVMDEIVVTVEKENEQLKEGLAGLGLSQSAQTMALSLQKFHGKGFKHVSEILGSGLVKNAMTTLEIIQKVERSILDAPDGAIDELELQYRKLDREYHLRLLAEYRKTFNEVQDAAMKQARIAMWRKESQAKTKSKAGFAPLMAVQVQPGGTVNIEGKGDK